MKHTRLIAIAALGLLLMASCSTDDGGNPTSAMGEDIQVTTHVSDVVTRGIFETATLQNFGICIEGKDDVASLLYNNVKMAKEDDGKWASSVEMIWPSAIPTADIIAYAPYQAEATRDLASKKLIPVSVKSVQTKEDKSSDFLVFKANGYSPTSIDENNTKRIDINFDHAMSQLFVTFNFSSEFTNADVDLSKIEDVAVDGSVLDGICDFTQEKPIVGVKPESSAERITPEQDSFQEKDEHHANIIARYSCLLIPQSIAVVDKPLTVSFRLGSTTYTWKSAADITLDQGKFYTLSLNIKKQNAVMEGNIKPWEEVSNDKEQIID